MTFYTVAMISLAVESVVITAIVLTLLNAFSGGRLVAAVRGFRKYRTVKLVHSSSRPQTKEPAPLRKAA
jgi:hypothetical protein